jgi:hypothetical protein
MTFRESEGCIVPLKLNYQLSGRKPGNAGVGKAPEPVRETICAPIGHSAESPVPCRWSRSEQRARRSWWGAGCVNGARPVLGGAGGQLDKDQIL